MIVNTFDANAGRRAERDAQRANEGDKSGAAEVMARTEVHRRIRNGMYRHGIYTEEAIAERKLIKDNAQWVR